MFLFWSLLYFFLSPSLPFFRLVVFYLIWITYNQFQKFSFFSLSNNEWLLQIILFGSRFSFHLPVCVETFFPSLARLLSSIFLFCSLLFLLQGALFEGIHSRYNDTIHPVLILSFFSLSSLSFFLLFDDTEPWIQTD